MAAPLLAVEDLRVRFDALRAVDGISFSIMPAEVHGLVGESGSGKSVTGMTLMGLTREIGATVTGRALLAARRLQAGTDSGAEIGRPRLNPRPLDLVTAGENELRQLRGDRLAMIFQDPLSSLNPFHRIGDQIAEAVLAHRRRDGSAVAGGDDRRWTREMARERAIELLAEVGIPERSRRARDFPHQFSGGMRQRVMIAMALANEPDLLIADEATTSLDMTTQAQILDLLMRLRDRHSMAVLLISHDLGVIAERAERVTVLQAGRVVEQGEVGEVFARPHADYTRRLLNAVPRLDRPFVPPPAPALPSAGSVGDESYVIGSKDRPRSCDGADYEGPLLELRDVGVAFTGRRRFWSRRGDIVRAVDGVSLSVERGSTLGIVGESGSGKSTLCRLMIRLLEPDEGSVRFDGQEIARLSGRELRSLRGSMQIVFQNPFASLNPRHRIGEIIAAPMRLHGQWRGRELEHRVCELLERVGLSPDDRNRYPHQFSGGQRQRIAIARALGPRPRLVVADEPVSALDTTIQAQVLDLLRELQADFGLTYVFVSHDLAVVRQIADRIAVMKSGRIVELGSAKQICAAPAHDYTQRLLAAVPRLPV